MGFRVSISDMSNVLEHSIDSVLCKVDTPDEASARSNDIGNVMQITGRIGTGEPTIDLYLWSLLPTNDPKAYRNVDVQMIGAQGQLLRKINFPNAFVVDYSESFSVYSGEGTFYILLKQKRDKNENVIVEGDLNFLDEIL
mgnify:CR=1 FL=1